MIKCKNCGAQLDINTEVCPYCGTVNDEATEHVKKMRHFESDYANVKKDVFSSVKTFSKGYGSLIILIVLLVACLVSIFVGGASYFIIEAISNANYQNNREEIIAKIENYIENEEYELFDAYMTSIEYNTYIDDFNHYRQLSQMTGYYQRIRQDIFNYIFEASTYNNPIDDLVQQVSNFYETAYEDYYDDSIDCSKLIAKVDDLMIKYFNFTSDDILRLHEGISESELSTILYERMEAIHEE